MRFITLIVIVCESPGLMFTVLVLRITSYVKGSGSPTFTVMNSKTMFSSSPKVNARSSISALPGFVSGFAVRVNDTGNFGSGMPVR